MESRHPIGVVSARTGLPQDLIRAWERRYRAIVPGRGTTGRRLYSDADIEKLRLLRRAVGAGRRISDVAALGLGELRALVEADREETSGSASPGAPTRPRAEDRSVSAMLDEAIEAIEVLDRHRLAHILNEASVELSGPALRQQFIAPLLERIGERWQEGTMRIVHEHMASTIVRSFMSTMRERDDRTHAPRIVVTTPSGQHHELGALMAAAVADDCGWDVYYLGPNLPAEEIAAAVRQLGARAVALSVAYRNGESRSLDEVGRLRGLVGAAVSIFVGGRAAAYTRRRLTELDVLCPQDLVQFRSDLQAALD